MDRPDYIAPAKNIVIQPPGKEEIDPKSAQLIAEERHYVNDWRRPRKNVRSEDGDRWDDIGLGPGAGAVSAADRGSGRRSAYRIGAQGSPRRWQSGVPGRARTRPFRTIWRRRRLPSIPDGACIPSRASCGVAGSRAFRRRLNPNVRAEVTNPGPRGGMPDPATACDRLGADGQWSPRE